MIYLNAASHGLPDATVLERVRSYAERELEIGVVRAAAEAADEIDQVRNKAATLIGASREEIAFTATTTIGWGMAVSSLPLSGKRVFVPPHEWASNIAILLRLEWVSGLSLEMLPMDADGAVDLDALGSAIDDDVAAICVPMVSSLTGRRYPIEAIGKLPRPESCAYIVDAAQALGQMPIDIRSIGCDILAATARKWLRAPRGNALLYVSSATLDAMRLTPFPDSAHIVWRPEMEMFDDVDGAERFEGFDFSVPLRLALGAAIDAANKRTVESIEHDIRALARHARSRIEQAGLTLHGPGWVQSGITSFLVPVERKTHIENALGEKQVAIKFPDFVNEPLAPAPEGKALLRLSPHVYNSREDIDTLFDVVSGCL